jgi:uncharacterized membrane protein YkvA (DUF1232 family)
MYEWQNNNEKGSKFSTMRKYVELYSETNLFDKLSKVGLKVGVEILFYAMLLFYLLADKSVSVRNKLIIMAALGYFILPTDLIADFIPILGFTDDAAFLSYALTSASSAITPEVKQKAKEKIKNLFNDKVDSAELDNLAEPKSDNKEKKD